MTALIYALGFICGLAAAYLLNLILQSKKRRSVSSDGLAAAYNGIINY